MNATEMRAQPRALPPSRKIAFLGSPKAALAIWSGLIGASALWGWELLRGGANFSSLDAPPLTGHFRPHLSAGLVLPVTFAALGIWLLPRAGARVRWRKLLLFASTGAFVWAVSLALVGGVHELVRPLLLSPDYLHDLGRVGDPATFLRHFTSNIGSYTTHVRAHPPGMLLLLWALRRVGLGGAWPAAFLVIAGGAAAVAAVLVSIREVAGEQAARAAAPFLAIAPAAIWTATSADALFAGVSAFGVALVVLATGRTGGRTCVYAIAGGVLFGCALMLSYGIALLAAIPVTVAVRRRRMKALAIACVGTIGVLAAFWALGFSWVSGLLATRREYAAYITRLRPYDYFLLANVAAFAIALGPAIGRAVARVQDPGIWLLVGSALVAVAAADLTGMSKGEVERIWLPFAPWVLAAAASIRDRARGWLAAQAIVALGITVLLRTPW